LKIAEKRCEKDTPYIYAVLITDSRVLNWLYLVSTTSVGIGYRVNASIAPDAGHDTISVLNS
jgi:uncharacterized OB-fold protein